MTKPKIEEIRFFYETNLYRRPGNVSFAYQPIGNNCVIVAMCFRNPKDHFDKRVARSILTNRCMNGGAHTFVYTIEHSLLLLDTLFTAIHKYEEVALAKDLLSRYEKENIANFVNQYRSYSIYLPEIVSCWGINLTEVDTATEICEQNEPPVPVSKQPVNYFTDTGEKVRFIHYPEEKFTIGIARKSAGARALHVTLAACHPKDLYSKKGGRDAIMDKYRNGSYLTYILEEETPKFNDVRDFVIEQLLSIDEKLLMTKFPRRTVHTIRAALYWY